MTDIPKVEEMLQLNFFLYVNHFVDRGLTGELARRSIQKFEKGVKPSTLQQSNLLRQRHELLLRIFSLQHL